MVIAPNPIWGVKQHTAWNKIQADVVQMFARGHSADGQVSQC